MTSNEDARCEAWLDRLLADPPPLSQRQEDLIAAAFAGALEPPRTKKVLPPGFRWETNAPTDRGGDDRTR